MAPSSRPSGGGNRGPGSHDGTSTETRRTAQAVPVSNTSPATVDRNCGSDAPTWAAGKAMLARTADTGPSAPANAAEGSKPPGTSHGSRDTTCARWGPVYDGTPTEPSMAMNSATSAGGSGLATT